MKIGFENSARRLSFLCRLSDNKSARINPCLEFFIDIILQMIIFGVFYKGECQGHTFLIFKTVNTISVPESMK